MKRMKVCPDRKKCVFFTLLELLIVIAIIAILAGMLLPALNAAREKSRGIQCASQMKTFGLNTIQYTVDFNEWCPTSYHYFASKATTPNFFTKELAPYYGINKPIGVANENGLNPQDCAKFLTCPSETGEKITDETARAKFRRDRIFSNYFYTCHDSGSKDTVTAQRSWGGLQYWANTVDRKKVHQITDNSIIALDAFVMQLWGASYDYSYGFFGEHLKRPQGINNYFSTSEPSDYKPSFSHNNTGPFLFKDGHVTAYKAGALRVTADFVVRH